MQWGRTVFLSVMMVLAAPSAVSAQVVINEVMYNPAGSDTGREWVELYNPGTSDVTMTGGSGKGSWRINDGSNHTLTDPASGTGRGSLVVPAGGYLVIANDPNEFLSGGYENSSSTYSLVRSSLSLNNNGATLTLLDGNGAAVDTMSYAPTQGGNDDGSSLQKQTDASWLSALPTPGGANSPDAYAAPEPVDTPSSTAKAATSAQTSPPEDSYVPPPTPDLYADAGTDRMVIVGADAEFDASAYDRSQQLLDPSTVRFSWNFGDGSAAEGAAILHHYSYPGTYALVLNLAEHKDAASAQITVTAQPAALALALLPEGGVSIQNLAGRDLDLSGWILQADEGAFASQFKLPPNSKILSGSSMNIAAQTLSFRAASSTVLQYPNGVFALGMGADGMQPTSSDARAQVAATAIPEETGVPAPVPENDADALVADAGAATIAATSSDEDIAASDSAFSAPPLQTASVASAPRSRYLWWLGIAALAGAVAAAAIAARHYKMGEWDIIEDSDT